MVYSNVPSQHSPEVTEKLRNLCSVCLFGRNARNISLAYKSVKFPLLYKMTELLMGSTRTKNSEGTEFKYGPDPIFSTRNSVCIGRCQNSSSN
jgi:hypothetical protein